MICANPCDGGGGRVVEIVEAEMEAEAEMEDAEGQVDEEDERGGRTPVGICSRG